MIKWKKTAKYSFISNQGHKLFIAYTFGEDKSVYTVFDPAGVRLGKVEDRAEIDDLIADRACKQA
jgi:hypothetical protein